MMLRILLCNKWYFIVFVVSVLFYWCNEKNEIHSKDWMSYLGGSNRNHFSDLDQINNQNVADLKIAWEYHSENGDSNLGQIQTNPIIVDGILYGISPSLKVFALNAATGKEIWNYDFQADSSNTIKHAARGLMYFSSGGTSKRIYFAATCYLFALDAISGKLISSFGRNGSISLKAGLKTNKGGDFYLTATSPGVIFDNLIIMGFRTSENMGAVPGNIRAYDLYSGDLAWTFNTIPLPNEPGYDTWPDGAYKFLGGANCWAGMSMDEERGIVYIPTGSASFDFYGGNRVGKNLYSNCLLALNARTGKLIWFQQLIHHDLWDRDLPAPPNLLTINKDGSKIDVVAQITKHGYVFVFNRETGEPIFEIKEVPVPVNTTLNGEQMWPTQPIPAKPPSFARHQFPQTQINDIDLSSKDSLTAIWENIRKGDIFTPPTTEGTLIFPGYDGGGEWGGAAVHPQTGIMYVNNSEMPWILTMVESNIAEGRDNFGFDDGMGLYLNNCAPCHGKNREGNPLNSIPSLFNLETRFNKEQVLAILNFGKNMMPAFSHLNNDERERITEYILGIERKEKDAHHIGMVNNMAHLPYNHTGYNRFVDSRGNPAIKPPWGTLSAIDLNEGEILWKVTLGELDELTAQGVPKTGTENYGGPIITEGGLIFIGATKDEYFRAFDINNGSELWRFKLPAGGYATPSTYMVNGQQYVVIACGGGKMRTKSGDSYIAFALP